MFSLAFFFCRILRLSQNEGHNKSFMPYKAAKQPCLLSLLITAKPYCRDASKNSYWRFYSKRLLEKQPHGVPMWTPGLHGHASGNVWGLCMRNWRENREMRVTQPCAAQSCHSQWTWLGWNIYSPKIECPVQYKELYFHSFQALCICHLQQLMNNSTTSLSSIQNWGLFMQEENAFNSLVTCWPWRTGRNRKVRAFSTWRNCRSLSISSSFKSVSLE